MARHLVSSIGNYPRIGEEKDQQRYRRALAHFQNREISAHALGDVEQSVVQEVIHEQVLTGVDEVTDGLVAWQDCIAHFCRNTAGIRIGGLSRLFDTNVYYRVPVIEARPRIKEPVIQREFRYAKTVTGKPVRVVMTGPFTLAFHSVSQLKPYNKFQARVEFFTELIQREIAAVEQDGATHVQIDEPALPLRPEELPAARSAIERLAAPAKVKLSLAISFHSAAKIYPALRSLPLHSLNLDFTVDPEAMFDALLAAPPSYAIGFGEVDARQTRADDVARIKSRLATWVQKTDPQLLYITPSAGLEFLPRDAARAKLALLARIRDEINAPSPAAAPHA